MAKIFHFSPDFCENVPLFSKWTIFPIFGENFPYFPVDEKISLFLKWTNHYWRKKSTFFLFWTSHLWQKEFIFGEKKFHDKKKALISVCLIRAMKGKKALISECMVRVGRREEGRRRIKAGRSRTSIYRDELPTIKPHYPSEGPRQGSCGVFWGVLILSRLLILQPLWNS